MAGASSNVCQCTRSLPDDMWIEMVDFAEPQDVLSLTQVSAQRDTTANPHILTLWASRYPQLYVLSSTTK